MPADGNHGSESCGLLCLIGHLADPNREDLKVALCSNMRGTLERYRLSEKDQGAFVTMDNPAVADRVRSIVLGSLSDILTLGKPCDLDLPRADDRQLGKERLLVNLVADVMCNEQTLLEFRATPYKFVEKYGFRDASEASTLARQLADWARGKGVELDAVVKAVASHIHDEVKNIDNDPRSRYPHASTSPWIEYFAPDHCRSGERLKLTIVGRGFLLAGQPSITLWRRAGDGRRTASVEARDVRIAQTLPEDWLLAAGGCGNGRGAQTLQKDRVEAEDFEIKGRATDLALADRFSQNSAAPHYEIDAVFDLTGVQPGIYDLRLVNMCGEEAASSPGPFTVDAPLEAGRSPACDR